MVAKPASPCYTLEPSGSSLLLKIPSPKRPFSTVFLIITLITSLYLILTISLFVDRALWAIVSDTSPNELLTDTSTSLILLSIVLLALGTFAVFLIYLAVHRLIWLLIGIERIEISPKAIQIARQAVGFEKPKIYDASRIENLRLSSDQPAARQPGPSRRKRSGSAGALAFDYGRKTIRFASLKEAEAQMALTEILERYPVYGKQENIVTAP